MNQPQDPSPDTGARTLARVVVGVDGSEHSSAALRWPAAEAQLRRATLQVVHAWHLPSLAYQAYVAPTPDEGRKVAVAALDDQLAVVLGDPTDLSVVRDVREGPAAQALIDAANGADLVVVGSRGHGGFAGLLLGSVSSQVVHHAPCPVVVVRP